MKLDADIKLIIGGAVVLGGLLWWFSRNGNAASVGKAVGGAAVDLISGAAVGVADAVVTTANDPSKNPLQPFGSWLGTTIYDYTHTTANGGVW